MNHPSKWHHIPDDWEPRLRAHLLALHSEERETLSAFDFRGDQVVRIKFVDGSFAESRYAFAIPNEALNEVMVFTEHCGYHVYPVKWSEVTTFKV